MRIRFWRNNKKTTATPELQGTQTAMSCTIGEEWLVRPDRRPGNERMDEDEDLKYFSRFVSDYVTNQMVPVASLTRIGWLDQRGRIWTRIPPGRLADEMQCGSFMPLLVDNREDGRLWISVMSAGNLNRRNQDRYCSTWKALTAQSEYIYTACLRKGSEKSWRSWT